jgi:hypothetical protein|tara:strand:- start:211 stop:369 length:159 start_codon:yes stop_codon:yes gene_type:complete
VVAVVELQTHQNPLEPVDLVVVELDKSPLKELQDVLTREVVEEQVDLRVHHT